MKYLYSCSFPLEASGGKSRATFQKIKALKKMVPSLCVVDVRPCSSKFGKLAAILRSEVSVLLSLISTKTRPDVYISRGFSGFIGVPIANFLGVFTVREIHADALGEANLMPYSFFSRSLLKVFSLIAVRADDLSKMRIFNHPDLLAWYKKTKKDCPLDVFFYNGADEESVSILSKDAARQKFGLTDQKKYLVFVGAASKWHGVQSLVSLQEEFNKHGDPVSIVCGGGQIPKVDDPEGVLVNFSPLDSRECADLIRAADACLLTLSNDRVSPGSPLKLYDYFVNGRAVITQNNVKGYSDEVEKYLAGVCTDFGNTVKARADILEYLASEKPRDWERSADKSRNSFSWSFRMKCWVSSIEKSYFASRPK